MQGVIIILLAVVGAGDVGETVVVEESSPAESGETDAARGWMGGTPARPSAAPRWTPCRGQVQRLYRYPVFPAEYYYRPYDYYMDFDYPWHKSPARLRGVSFHGAPTSATTPTSPRPTRIEPIPMEH